MNLLFLILDFQFSFLRLIHSLNDDKFPNRVPYDLNEQSTHGQLHGICSALGVDQVTELRVWSLESY